MLQELDELHDFYAVAINTAIEDDDPRLAEQLAERYDTDAIQLIAEREGLTHLLPIRRPAQPDSALRRLVARLTRRADDHTLWAFNPSPALSGRRER
jgi:hypothetical protein